MMGKKYAMFRIINQKYSSYVVDYVFNNKWDDGLQT